MKAASSDSSTSSICRAASASTLEPRASSGAARSRARATPSPATCSRTSACCARPRERMSKQARILLPSGCSRRSKRAKRPVATSEASNRRRSSFTRARTTRSSTCGSTTTPSRSPSSAASTTRRTNASSRTCAARRARRGPLACSIARASRKRLPGTANLLEVRGLRTSFAGESGEVRAVDGVDFSLARGRTLGIVGESGCGKSVTALSIMRLVPQPPGRIDGGEVLFDGVDLLTLPDSRMRSLRGDQLSMIFQEPMTSLNPAFPVGEQIAEALLRHRNVSKSEARHQAIEMLRRVRIPSPESRADDYPHQLSGGMRQRVMIAMALACNPHLLIADEPTTALDVTIQAQIMELMKELKREEKASILLITHDLGVIAGMCDRVVVMYGGRVLESGTNDAIFLAPRQPYTQGLLQSIPRIDLAATQKTKLEQIPGTVPTLRGDLRPGCRFAPRCALAKPMHFENTPPLKEVRPGHKVACFLY